MSQKGAKINSHQGPNSERLNMASMELHRAGVSLTRIKKTRKGRTGSQVSLYPSISGSFDSGNAPVVYREGIEPIK